jgi:hypothetical protein
MHIKSSQCPQGLSGVVLVGLTALFSSVLVLQANPTQRNVVKQMKSGLACDGDSLMCWRQQFEAERGTFQDAVDLPDDREQEVLQRRLAHTRNELV